MAKELYIILGFILSIGSGLKGQDLHTYLRKGNQSYRNNIYVSAEENYRKAIAVNANDYKANFNLGNALYQETRYDEVEAFYTAAASLTQDSIQKADAYFNLGNAFFLAKDFEKAIESYKNALRENPGDMDAKENLFYAQNMHQKQQQQKQQQQQDKKDGEGDKNKDQKQDQKKDGDPQDKKDGDKASDKQEDDSSKNEKQEEAGKEGDKKGDKDKQAGKEGDKKGDKDKQAQAGEGKAGKLSKEDVDRLLQIQEAEEKNIQGKLHKGEGVKPSSGKDW